MRYLFLLGVAVTLMLFSSCSGTADNSGPGSKKETADVEKLNIVDRPQKIVDMISARGEQDKATPSLKIIEPTMNAVLTSSTVNLKLELAGDLKGYKPGMNEETHTGNHIHVILDNQPYEAYYDLDKEFEIKNLSDGEHTIRVFPSRPWHESYKNDGAFQIVKFTVKGGGAKTSEPASANGDQMSKIGNDVEKLGSDVVNPTQPLLTYSRPKGEYKDSDADAIMIDFWISNASLVGDGGDHRVRLTISSEGKSDSRFIDKWAPVWISGLSSGKHLFQLELVDKNGNVVKNGNYNSTSREVTLSK